MIKQLKDAHPGYEFKLTTSRYSMGPSPEHYVDISWKPVLDDPKTLEKSIKNLANTVADNGYPMLIPVSKEIYEESKKAVKALSSDFTGKLRGIEAGVEFLHDTASLRGKDSYYIRISSL